MGSIKKIFHNFHPMSSAWLFIIFGYWLIGEVDLFQQREEYKSEPVLSYTSLIDLDYLCLERNAAGLRIETLGRLFPAAQPGAIHKSIPAGSLAAVVADKPAEAEAALYLYRQPLTRPLVTAFFVNLTGSKTISLPILTWADKDNIPLCLAFSLAWTESRFREQAFNINRNSVDRGLFQLNSLAFPELTEKECFNPALNARYGLGYFRSCLAEGKNEVVALAMYNAGKNRVRTGTPLATLHFIAQVLAYRDALEERFKGSLVRPERLVRS